MALNPALRLMAAKASAAAFTPTDISGLIVWLDASDASTFTYSSGTVVSQWNDKSGGSRHFAESSTSSQPSRSGTQNGLSTVVFDGSNDRLTYDAGSDSVDVSPWTCFIVCVDSLSSNGYRRVFVSRRSAIGAFDYQSPNAYFGGRDNTAGFNASSAGTSGTGKSYTQGNWIIARSTFDGANVQVAVNGTTAAAAAASAPGNMRYLRVGAGCTASANPPTSAVNEFWNGAIAEVVLYNAALSAGDITSVESYLNTKWAVY